MAIKRETQGCPTEQYSKVTLEQSAGWAGGAWALQMGSPVGWLLHSLDAGRGGEARGIANMYVALVGCLHCQSSQQPCEADTVISPT